eukprot:s758_g2.t1
MILDVYGFVFYSWNALSGALASSAMPPHLESDDVDDIKSGTYVYWMKANEDCRCIQGVGIGPNGDTLDMGSHGSHCSQQQRQDVAERGELGEVLRVDDDNRRKVSFPKGNFSILAHQLNVSDFQKGTFVHMTDADTDLIGEIKELDNGKLQVEIEGKQKTLGVDIMLIVHPKNLIRCDFQPGMFVFWTRSDEDILPGHMGDLA